VHLAVLRNRSLCVADLTEYSIVDLTSATLLPLLPISQDPQDQEGSPIINPNQKPAIAAIGENEFLVASHTGTSTLGVFVRETGEPCRGTVEWASNVRSVGACEVKAIYLTMS
jgi:hypothetical protein